MPSESKSTVFMNALRRGATLTAAVAESGLGLEHGKLLLEHLQRTGLLAGGADSADSIGPSCASGACSPGIDASALSEHQRLHCIGCTLSSI